MPHFIALIRQDESGCRIEFPDLPGCSEVADTIEDARDGAATILSFHLEDLARSRKPIPEPSRLDAIVAGRVIDGMVVLSVFAPDPRVKKVRICSWIREDLLEKFDEAARALGMSRSEYLSESGFQMLSRDVAP